MLSGLIGSLVLVINQKTPLFTKHHMANEVFVIVTAGFLVSGAYYFLRNKKYLLNRNTDSESTVNRHGR
jgi:hypothetical protein